MWKPDWSKLDGVRARAHAALDKVPGVVGDKLRGLNEAAGRPFADNAELADRRAFEARATAAGGPAPAMATTAAQAARTAAPVIVYHMDKTRRDATRLTEILDSAQIPYQVLNIEGDAAAQMAVRRDSKGFRLPLVFIAGEVVGGRNEVTNLATTGELARKVFG